MTAWDVYIDKGPHECGIHIDTVFYDDDCDAEWVYKGLVEHDGYRSDIYVENGDRRYPDE